jgi:branched-chain amino acid aminotransferase
MSAAPFHAFLNGKIIPLSEAGLPLTDLGILRGYGVGEVVRTYAGQPFHLADHLERMRHSAKQFHLRVPYSDQEISAVISELLRRNFQTGEEATIKLYLTGGHSDDGLTFNEDTPSFFILVLPLRLPEPELYASGVKVLTVNHQRPHPGVKSLNYQNALFHLPERQNVGAYEVLYHDGGLIREAATSNIFFFLDDCLVTPHRRILPGITRKLVLDLAKEHYTVEERDITLAEALLADEAFLTATNKEVLPVVKLDEAEIGDGKPGKRSRHLLELYRHYVRDYVPA